MLSDRDRQPEVAQAARGCMVALVLLMAATVAAALLAWGSVAMILLAALLIAGGVGLVVVDWAARE